VAARRHQADLRPAGAG